MGKKIGIFSGYYLPHLGGVERYVDKLSGALIKLGYEVVIVTSNHEDLPATEIVDGKKIYRLPVHNLAKNRYPIPRKNEEYSHLRQKIIAEHIDYFILNTRFHLTSLVGARMGKQLGKPVLLIDHGTGHFTVGNTLLDFFGKIYEHALTAIIKKYVDRYYGVSQACNVWLRHFGIKATGVFYNSIDTKDQKNVKDYYEASYRDADVLITYAGRLLKEKGILNLLQAFVEVREAAPKLKMKLVVAGDGDLLDTLRENYEDQTIEFVGRLDFAHVMSLYKRTDIFVYPSLYPEGLPTSILEGGLMKCAVIATPKGGTEEVITSNKYGIITDGSVADLKDAILELSVSLQKRNTLSTNLERRVKETFDWKVVAKKVDEELKQFK